MILGSKKLSIASVPEMRDAWKNIGQLYQTIRYPTGKKGLIKLNGSGIFFQNRANNPAVISHEDEEV